VRIGYGVRFLTLVETLAGQALKLHRVAEDREGLRTARRPIRLRHRSKLGSTSRPTRHPPFRDNLPTSGLNLKGRLTGTA
jgi:hypothetical protein